MIRKHLYWDREEFERLSEDDQRIYSEGLVRFVSGKDVDSAPQHSTTRDPLDSLPTRVIVQPGVTTTPPGFSPRPVGEPSSSPLA